MTPWRVPARQREAAEFRAVQERRVAESLQPEMSAFGGKADMTYRAQMSANDPKRTSRKRYTMMISRGSTGVFVWPFAGA